MLNFLLNVQGKMSAISSTILFMLSIFKCHLHCLVNLIINYDYISTTRAFSS